MIILLPELKLRAQVCLVSRTEDTGVNINFSVPHIQMELMPTVPFMSYRTATKANTTERKLVRQKEAGNFES